MTGGSGFVGRNLVQKLSLMHEVAILARSNFGCGSERVFVQDIGENFSAELVNFDPEVIYHLAWSDIPDFSSEACLKNIGSQILFFDQLTKFNSLRTVIVSGTCKEYPDFTGKCAEEYLGPGAGSKLGWAKRSLFEYLMTSDMARGYRLVWARLFYVFGPGQRSGSLLQTVAEDLKMGKLTALKNPVARNDFVFIADAVKALVLLMNSSGGIYNVGSGVLTSNYDLLRTAAKIIKFPLGLLELDSNDLGRATVENYADISKLSREFDWRAETSLHEGIKLTLECHE